MNTIYSSILDSLALVKSSRFWILFFIQLIFLILLAVSSLYFAPIILDDTITDFKSNQELFLNVSNNLLASASPLLIAIFFTFLTLNGIVWYGANSLVYKKSIKIKKDIIYYLAKFFLISLVFTLGSYSIIKMRYIIQDKNSIILLLLSFVLIYFSYITLPILDNKLKHIPKKSYKIGKGNFFTIVMCYIINTITLFGVFALILLTIRILPLALFFLILSIAVFVWNKIFLIIVMKKLSSF